MKRFLKYLLIAVLVALAATAVIVAVAPDVARDVHPRG